MFRLGLADIDSWPRADSGALLSPLFTQAGEAFTFFAVNAGFVVVDAAISQLRVLAEFYQEHDKALAQHGIHAAMAPAVSLPMACGFGGVARPVGVTSMPAWLVEERRINGFTIFEEGFVLFLLIQFRIGLCCFSDLSSLIVHSREN